MQLAPHETARFYRLWFALLHYVNQQRQFVPPFSPVPGETSIRPADALKLCDALWADDAQLFEQFVAANPAGLTPDDLALVAIWRNRVEGSFFILRYLKKHAVFLAEGSPTRAYGVLGLVSPLAEILGPELPLYVRATLLPYEDRITYDGLLAPYPIHFGSGIRRSLNEAYRNAQEHEGIITSLRSSQEAVSTEAERAGIRRGNARVLTAFRRELAKAGLGQRTTEGHVAAIDAFAQQYLLTQDPPRGLVGFEAADLAAWESGGGKSANRVSFRRFVRFLADTSRMDSDAHASLSALLKSG